MQNNDNSSERVFVSRLIIRVLTGSLCVRDALLRFPANSNDSSIETAWHALSHYEADEDIRKSDKLYKEEQDNYLEFIAETLKNNKELPENIIDEYKNYYRDIPISDTRTVRGFFKKIMRFLNI